MAQQPSETNQPGTILLVGEHGEIKRIRHKKGVVVLLLIALIISMAVSGGLYVLHQRDAREKALRSEELRRTKEQVLSLRGEKEKLMARLVLMESRSIEEAAVDPGGGVGEAGLEAGGGAPDEGVYPGSEENGGGAPDGATAPASTEPSPPRVDADNLEVVWDKENSALRVRLKVVNVDPSAGSIAGYALLTLTPQNADGDKRLLFPGGAWTTKKTFDSLKGYLFSISNFKVIRFKPKKMAKQRLFSAAEVHIHAENGALILQKEFTIQTDGAGVE